MTSLRQRLLLVAGWAVAAVATGLVSAGAVAVAGGQVNDRPLRPLSAAEVAALPVTNEDACGADGPLASGGPTSSSCLDRASSNGLSTPGDETARPAEKEPSEVALPPFLGDIDAYVDPYDPAGPDVAPQPDPGVSAGDVATPGTEGRFPEDAVIPPIGPRPPEPFVVELVGGRVSVSDIDGALALNWATPRPGFVADLSFERRDELTVTFWNGAHLSSLTATITADGLDVDTTERAGRAEP
jgi:hypothetical protein